MKLHTENSLDRAVADARANIERLRAQANSLENLVDRLEALTADPGPSQSSESVLATASGNRRSLRSRERGTFGFVGQAVCDLDEREP
jgi:hypothetical protein